MGNTSQPQSHTNQSTRERSYLCIPNLDSVKAGVNFSRLGEIAGELYEHGEIRDDGRIEVLIDLDLLGYLTRQEIEIIEGIILANGHTYYEVSNIEDEAMATSMMAVGEY